MTASLNKSYFITLEGIEGAGKSTLLSILVKHFKEEKSLNVITTREPGSTLIGKKIREIVLDRDHANLNPITELMLFAADRAQHVAEVIRPAINRGTLVICDRYIHSTLAYQGFGRGIDLNILEQLNHLSTGGLKPDLVLLLDLDPMLGLSRARNRSSNQSKDQSQNPDAWNRFEDQELAFHHRIREGFLTLAKDPANRIATIDGSLPPEQITETAYKEIRKLFKTAGDIA